MNFYLKQGAQTMRSFDPKQQFEEIKKSATSAIQEIFPIQGKEREIILEKVWVEDNLAYDDYKGQQDAKDKDSTWGAPVYASLALIEKASKKKLDVMPKAKLFTLPKITNRFSYIVGGNEYQAINQLRLKSGAYTIRKQNGELKTQVNLAKGGNFDLSFDEKTGVFYIKKIRGGQANIPLYPVLTYMGISPSGIASAWGGDLERVNHNSDSKVVARAATAFGVKQGETLKDHFAGTSISPETAKLTLGHAFDKVDGPMLLAASKNLLEVHLGKKEPTELDSLSFKELHSLEDYLKERIDKNKRSLSMKLQRNVDSPRRTKLTQIVNPGTFNSVVQTFFTQDDKATTPEQLNPLEMLSGHYGVTMLRSGGITSRHAIRPEVREIHPTHYGFIDPIASPESDKVGVNLHLPLGTIKDGKTLKTIVYDEKAPRTPEGTKKTTAISPTEAFNSYVAFPNQDGKNMVKVQYQGNVTEVPRAQVQYSTTSPASLFSWSTNLVPFLASNQGNRAMMASKQLEQAISLKHREEPLVQVATPGNPEQTFEKRIGQELVVKAADSGVIKEVTPDFIAIKTSSGVQRHNLYNNFALNRKSFLHHYPKVKVGDKVKAGQVLAESNFTRNGTLALGTNLRAAYIPYKGLTFEDAIVISEGAAKKLTSEHIHKKTIDISDNTILGIAPFRNFYPNALSVDNVRKLGADGIIKKGEKIRQGEALAAVLERRTPSPTVGLVTKALSDRPKDSSIYWTIEDEGTVIDVQKLGGKIQISVKTEEKAKIGDKLSGRYGNKGVVSKILPDNEVPHTADGQPIDIMLNPHGVISRINIGQIYESAAAKAAAKKGAPIAVQNFTGENYLEKTKQILADAGVNDKQELFDPITKKSLGQVHVGIPHILKLSKQGTVNYSVRQGGPGEGYDANQQPLKGGEEGSKSMDLLTVYSLLAHGARANLREMSTIKGGQNDEFWKALKGGQMLPPPKTPFVYEKFMSFLRGAGIDVKKQGSQMTLAPLTDAQIKAQSHGEIKKPLFYNGKDMTPKTGGFFDPVLTGGFKGTRWNHLDLAEPVVNPVFENAVSKLTGLGKKYDEVVGGRMHYDPKTATFNTEGKGLTGGKAVEHLLSQIDVDKEITSLQKKIVGASGAKLDDANKRLRYLTALKEQGLKPQDAYIRKVLPVLPPVYRPIYPLPDGSIASSDINYLYQNVGLMNTLMKQPVMALLPEEEKHGIRTDFANHIDGVAGLTDINIKGRPRKGFISEIKGGQAGSPKEGFFIEKMLSKKQDFVGRGVIIPEPDLGIDQMAMPEEMAWKLFEPFVVRKLKEFSKTPLQAMDEIKKRTPLAKRALEQVMENRHVLLNRAPSLHKFSIMAFKPTITSGRSLKLPPLVFKGFNADVDGDCQLTAVLTQVPRETMLSTINTYSKDFWEDRIMTARFREQVPVLGAGNELCVFHLEDFPHGELIKSQDASNGRIDFYRALPGMKVLALDEETGHLTWQDVYGWSKHYGREIEIVNLASGRQILTDDDPRAVYGVKCGTLGLTRATPTEALKQHMLVPRSQRLSLVDVPRGASDDSALTFELGYLIGSVAANGWVEHKHAEATGKVFICTDSDEVGEQFLSFSAQVFQRDVTAYRYQRPGPTDGAWGPAKKWGYSNPEAAKLFRRAVGTGARQKHLPPYFYASPEKFRLGLFAGLMDNDGSIIAAKAASKNKPQLMAGYCSASIRLIQEVRLLAESLGIRGRIVATSTPAGEPFWNINFSNIDIARWECHGMVHQRRLASFAECSVAEDSPSLVKNDIVPISFALAAAITKAIGAPRNSSKDRKCLYQIFHRARTSGYVTRHAATRVFEWVPESLCKTLPEWDKWWSIVQSTDVTWDQVVSVDRTKVREDGYDLTVPGYETFVNIDGIVLSNTMTVHTVITDEANQEALKLLPSRNLFKPGTGALMVAPSQEAQIGLFYLSKTEAGRKQLSAITGPRFPVTGVLDKKASGALLLRMAKEMKPDEYAKAVADLKRAGENHTYETGFTLGLSDIVGIGKDRDKIVQASQEVARKAGRGEALDRESAKAGAMLDEAIERKLKDKNNPLFDMVNSGARGDKTQLRSILATPLFMADAKGRTIPSPIKKSYAEGLDIGDYWVSMYGARRGAMERSIQTSLPGAFSKDIMATTLDNVVSAQDCGTHDGISLPVDDADALDRFLAGDQSGFAHNTLVTHQVQNALKAKGAKQVKVRSQLTCHRAKGVCAKCHGLDEHGHEPQLGDNIGAKAGQTIAEPLIQMVMNVRHTGGVAGAKGGAVGYKRIDQLLKLPDTVEGAATLAPITGKVTKVEKGVGGGFDVHVGGKKAYVATGLKVLVKPGDMVEAGDRLSEGVIRPQDLVATRGMQPAQLHLVNELQAAYKSQGVPMQKRVFETVVRSMGNTTKVVNNPADSGYIPGDVAPYTVVQAYNRDLVEEKAVDDAQGYQLAEAAGGMPKGQELTQGDIRLLKARGVSQVKVKKEAIKHTPFLKGLRELPILKRDWMSSLGYQKLTKALTEGASQGWKTDVSSYHPVPAFAHGTTFGKGREGKY